jgi:hypothetical protein
MSYPPELYLLVDLDGALCVLKLFTIDTEPKARALWWPTGARTYSAVQSWGPEILNQPLEAVGRYEHGFKFLNRSLPRFTIQLEQQGRTLAIRSEVYDAPPPPKNVLRGKPYRWVDGQWVRMLAKGPERIGVPLVEILRTLGYAP